MTIQGEEGLLPAAERFHLGTMQAAKAKSLANEVSELQSPTKPLVLSLAQVLPLQQSPWLKTQYIFKGSAFVIPSPHTAPELACSKPNVSVNLF
jgi:hypothetical protein